MNTSELVWRGFRPLLGFFISKLNERSFCEMTLNLFSSPTGVLYFKIQVQEMVRRWCERFSSPTGVLYFKILSSTPTEFRGVSDHFAAQITKQVKTFEKTSPKIRKTLIFRASAQNPVFSLHSPCYLRTFHNNKSSITNHITIRLSPDGDFCTIISYLTSSYNHSSENVIIRILLLPDIYSSMYSIFPFPMS